jgi:hypothetical protein
VTKKLLLMWKEYRNTDPGISVSEDEEDGERARRMDHIIIGTCCFPEPKAVKLDAFLSM